MITNTFHVPASAKHYHEFTSVEDLIALLKRYPDEVVLPIGAASNILFTHDFDGLVLRSGMRRARALEEDADSVLVNADAGLTMDDLIAQLADMGLRGLENLSGIPGTVGASAVQNVGAYGVEAGDRIVAVEALDRECLTICTFDHAQCAFGYRDSFFKHTDKRYIITSVTYRLSKGGAADLSYAALKDYGLIPQSSAMQVREAVLAIRDTKLPNPAEIGSAGSFFRNPVLNDAAYEQFLARLEALGLTPPRVYETDGTHKVSAAWLIEQAGLKGRQVGGAAVYERQPLVLINATGAATADDIQTLARLVIDTVQERFGIELVPECEII